MDNIQERRERVYPGGLGRTSAYLGRPAPTLVRGSGYYVWDSEGVQKIDLNNNFTTLLHGHAHPEVTAAATRALEAGACFGLPNPKEVAHAESLLSRVPWCDQVRYTNSGTEAVMTAVRMARALTRRDRVLGLSSSYHGTGEALLPMQGTIAGVPQGVTDDVLLVAPNDADELRAMFSLHGGEIAAIVLDMMPMNAGGRPLNPQFVATAATLARQHGALVIVDEVISFRLHVQGFANAVYDLYPDLLVTGKSIGGGLPMGAILGRRDVMTILDSSKPGALFHGGTFTGNPVSMSAGLVAMNLFHADEVGRLNELGERLRAGLTEGGQVSGWTANGYGSVVRLNSRDQNPARRMRDLFWIAFEEGIALAPSGTLCVSTPMNDEVIDTLIERLACCFHKIDSGA
ncbi:aminotransferase class III-fold pyridoxal phosphate-dependent enzyme [Nocardioides sp. JQ2195]|nr:aminotransferase class III-fold pyridoxal phosphate-dependent enzyme [Nocardioides sp. JQ2195]